MTWRSCAMLALGLISSAGALVGCGQAPSSAAAPTWYGQVQPIVAEHCAFCHEPGGVSGVPLDFPANDPAAYEEAKPIFADAVSVIDSGEMPFWLADRSCRHYQQERSLSAADKQIFRDFVQGGSVRGDPSQPRPAFAAPTLARVGAALTPSAAYLPVAAPNTTSDTRCFVLDPALAQATDVIGFDLRPGSERVHRAQLFSVPGAAAHALDAADSGVGYGCSGGPGADAALIGAYVPGVVAQEYPAGTGIRLAPGSTLVLQIVYDLQTGDAEPDQTEVELEYAAAPVPHPARFEAITNASFSIPARASGFTAQAAFSNTQASTLWGVAPHLRNYGRRAQMALTQAAGQACLVDVQNWDPIWEQGYFFAEPSGLALAPGDSITVTCTWDNPGEVAVVSGAGNDGEACVGYAYISND